MPNTTSSHARRLGAVALAALTGFGSVATSPGMAAAQATEKGSIRIERPWIRATPGGAKVAGGFMRITNTGKEPDRLIGGASPASKHLEVHEMTMEGDVMRMRMLPKGLEIPPGQTVELKPGSYHIMFIDLVSPMIKGERVKGRLVFEKAGEVEVEYEVDSIGANRGSDHGSGSGAGSMKGSGAGKH